jgi:hypothetical protein
MMFWLTEANVSCNNLSAVVTHEHVNSASSLTHLQSLGRGRMLGQLGKRSPNNPEPMASDDPGAGAA